MVKRVFIYTTSKEDVQRVQQGLDRNDFHVQGQTEYANAVKVLQNDLFDAVVIGREVKEEEREQMKRAAHEHSPLVDIVEDTGDVEQLKTTLKPTLDLDLSE